MMQREINDILPPKMAASSHIHVDRAAELICGRFARETRQLADCALAGRHHEIIEREDFDVALAQ